MLALPEATATMSPVALAGDDGMLAEAEADGDAGLLDGEELVVELQAARAMTKR